MIYLQLMVSYLKIGFFGFGGGYAMLSLIQNEIVEQRAWLTPAQFADIVAVSQCTPGPIAINSATYIGYTVAGFWGSVVATLAVCVPALTIMLAVSRFYLKLRDNVYVSAVMKSLRPIVLGMIASAALLLVFPSSTSCGSMTDMWSWVFFLGTLYGCHRRINPIMLIMLAAAAGVFVYHVPSLVSAIGPRM